MPEGCMVHLQVLSFIPPATFDTAYKKHGCIFESAGSVLHVEAGVLRDFTCMVSEHFDEPVQFIWRYYAGWPLCHQPADQQPQPKDRAERHQLWKVFGWHNTCWILWLLLRRYRAFHFYFIFSIFISGRISAWNLSACLFWGILAVS